jgi:hypothetical protein
MSDHDGGTSVDSSNADYDDSENDDVLDAAGREPLSFAGVMFWIFVGFLGLLGICVIVTIILALVKGT